MPGKRNYDDTHSDDARLVSPSSSKVRRKHVTPAVPGLPETEFSQQRKSFYQQSMESANTILQKRVAECAGDDELLLYVGLEHRRVVSEINNLYHNSEGLEVAMMGMDDTCQLGLRQQQKNDEGNATEYIPTINRSIGNIIDGSCGGLHSAAVTYDGKVYTWGCNDDGALGRQLPKEAEEDEDGKPVVDDDGKQVYTEKVYDVSKIREGFGEDNGKIIAVSAGDSHTIFLTIDGKVYATGGMKENDSKHFKDVPADAVKCIGINCIPVEVKMPSKLRAVAINAGYSFNVATLEDGSLATWGMGQNGQLARSEHMGATIEGGKYQLGRSYIGEEIVIGKEFDEEKGEEVEVKDYKFDEAKVVKNFLTPKLACWSTLGKKKILSVACGEMHMLAVVRTHSAFESEVYASGCNSFGNLGIEDPKAEYHKLTPIKDFEGKMITKVAAGKSHSLAMNMSGSSVYTWGAGGDSQLGTGVAFKAGKFEYKPTQVPFPSDVSHTLVKDIGAGALVSFAILENNDVYSWGYNDSWQTGISSENQEDVKRPRKVNVLRKYKNDDGEIPDCHVFKADGGGQHSMLLVKKCTYDK